MRIAILLLAAACAAFAQFDDNVVTITASRQVTSAPDQVQIGVTVTTDQNQALDAVLAALPSGFGAANLSSVSASGPAGLQWIFTETVPVAGLAGALAGLNAASTGSKFAIGYYVQGTTTSVEGQCPYPALIADARAQANQLALAAGVTLGPIVTISQQSTPLNVLRSGEFSSSSFLLGVISNTLISAPLASPASSCALTVQFQIAP